jgi:hypothetical protein
MTNGNGRDHDRRILNVLKWSRPMGISVGHNNVLGEIRPVPLNE